MTASLILSPGAYDGIDINDYHGNVNLLPAPALSASGAKKIIMESPFHFWANSPMNPKKPVRKEPAHFRIGRASHDMFLQPEIWRREYHVTPDGFDQRKQKQYSEAIEARDFALDMGKTILSFTEKQQVDQLADAIGLNDLAGAAMADGVAEQTIVWQDEETGVWLRCRPDFLPNAVIAGADLRVVSDLKFMAPRACTPEGFSRAIFNFGYHIAAAFYFAGIEAVYGHRPTNWVHIVVEKEFPFSVQIYELPQSDIDLGAFQMREAIRTFADCLEKDSWPSFAPDPVMVGLPPYIRRQIAEHGSMRMAALINANGEYT